MIVLRTFTRLTVAYCSTYHSWLAPSNCLVPLNLTCTNIGLHRRSEFPDNSIPVVLTYSFITVQSYTG